MFLQLRWALTLLGLQWLVWACTKEDCGGRKDRIFTNQHQADWFCVFSGFANIQNKLSPQKCPVVCKTPCLIWAAHFPSFSLFLETGTANFVLPHYPFPMEIFLSIYSQIFITKDSQCEQCWLMSVTQQIDLGGPFFTEIFTPLYICDQFCLKVCCYPKGSCSRSPSSLVVFYNWEGRFQLMDIPPCFLRSLMGLLDSFYEYLWLEWTQNVLWSFYLQCYLFSDSSKVSSQCCFPVSLVPFLFCVQSPVTGAAVLCFRQDHFFHSDPGEIRCLSALAHVSTSQAFVLLFPDETNLSHSHRQENSPLVPIASMWFCTVKSRWKRV